MGDGSAPDTARVIPSMATREAGHRGRPAQTAVLLYAPPLRALAVVFATPLSRAQAGRAGRRPLSPSSFNAERGSRGALGRGTNKER